MKIYIQRKINCEQDLPKKADYYYVKTSYGVLKLVKLYFVPGSQEYIRNWMVDYTADWYLEPIEVSDEGAEEIFEIMFGGLNGEKGCYHFPDLKEWVLFCMKEYAAIQVAKALDKENKLSEIEKLAQSVNPYDTRSVKAGRKKFKAALNGEIKKEQ
jgi:hypothetical protein